MVKWFDSKPYEIKRDKMGMIIVAIDFVVMLVLLMAIWSITYLVRNEQERHTKLLVETKEFALEFRRIPAVSKDYTIDMLKAELWSHIEDVIFQEKQQIMRL